MTGDEARPHNPKRNLAAIRTLENLLKTVEQTRKRKIKVLPIHTFEFPAIEEALLQAIASLES